MTESDEVLILVDDVLEAVVVLNRSDPLFANTEKLARIVKVLYDRGCQEVDMGQYRIPCETVAVHKTGYVCRSCRARAIAKEGT